MSDDPPTDLFAAAAACLLARDPDEKLSLTERTAAHWRAGRLALPGAPALDPASEPGRPERPELVHPRDLAKRSVAGRQGRAALIHAVAHIEFNARVMEARGLDVTPGMIDRLRAGGDEETARRLEIILSDEVGHVAAGSRWFRHLCAERGLDPRTTFFALVEMYLDGKIRGPLNRADRLRAGFDEAELDRLAG